MPSWAIYGNERRRGITLVPEGINLLTQPSAFDHADWTKLALATVSANTDGTGDTIIEDGTQAFHGVLQSVTKAAESVTYNLSVRVKEPGDSRQRIVLQLDDGVDDGRKCIIDVRNGTELGVAPSGFGTTFSGGTANITAEANGWFLCEFDGVTTGSETTVRVVFGLDAATGTDAEATNYTGTGTSGLILDEAILVVA
jgi:hypothetical protein